MYNYGSVSLRARFLGMSQQTGKRKLSSRIFRLMLQLIKVIVVVHS